MWGLTLDTIQSINLVLANGSIAMASLSQNSDLFWVKISSTNPKFLTNSTFRSGTPRFLRFFWHRHFHRIQHLRCTSICHILLIQLAPQCRRRHQCCPRDAKLFWPPCLIRNRNGYIPRLVLGEFVIGTERILVWTFWSVQLVHQGVTQGTTGESECYCPASELHSKPGEFSWRRLA